MIQRTATLFATFALLVVLAAVFLSNGFGFSSAANDLFEEQASKAPVNNSFSDTQENSSSRDGLRPELDLSQ